jgi:hypothetical protein
MPLTYYVLSIEPVTASRDEKYGNRRMKAQREIGADEFLKD